MKRLLASLLLAAALPAAAAGYKSMWITEVMSGRTVGPVVNKPGNRFSAGGREWIVLQSQPGEINFADATTLTPQGPYGLVEQRMFQLGDDAYLFTRVADYEGSTPGADEAVVTQAERAPAEKGRRSWSADAPERWVLAPLPSTNPGAHKEPGKTWSLETLDVAPSATVWFEPVRKTPYDWKLGGLAGTDADLETRRLGVTGFWNGFFAEAAFVAGGKSSGSLVPDGTTLSSLKLGGGDGWQAGAGYRHAFVIDGGWSADLSLFGSWESISADLTASTMTETEIPPEPETDDGTEDPETDGGAGTDAKTETKAAYAFGDWKKDVSFEEFRLCFGIGLQYNDWYWGMGARVLFDCWTDTSVDAKVPVLDKNYELEAERGRPIGVQASLWYCPVANWFLEGSLVLSSETSVRIGTGFFF